MTTTHTVRITNTTRVVGAGRALSLEGNDFTGGPGRSVRLYIPDQSYIDVDLHRIQFDRDLLTALGVWITNGLATVTLDGVNQTASEVTLLTYGLGGTSSSSTSLYVMKGQITAAADFPLPESDPSDPVQGGDAYLVTASPNVTDNDPSKTNTGLIFNESIVIAWDGTGHTWMEIPNDLVAELPLIHVDGNRTDFYAANGSESHPYKTIAAAIAVAAAGDTIVVAYKTASPYAENCVIPAGVSLEGISGNYTYINGNITMGASPCSLKYIVNSGAANVLTINGGTTMRDFYSYGQLSLPLATSKVQMWNCHINAVNKNAVILADAAAEFYLTMGTLATTNDFATVLGTNGKIMLDHVIVTGNRAADPIIDSVAGTCRVESCAVLNAGAGAAMDVSNGAGASDPNFLHGTLVRGAVLCGAAVTQIDNVTGGAITGTATISPTSPDRVVSVHAGLALTTGAAQVDAALNGRSDQFFHPRRIVVKLTGITNAPAGDAHITIGTSHAGTEILPSTELTGLVGVGEQFVVGLTGHFPAIAANATFHVTVTTADTGAAAVATATVTVEGDAD